MHTNDETWQKCLQQSLRCRTQTADLQPVCTAELFSARPNAADGATSAYGINMQADRGDKAQPGVRQHTHAEHI